MSVHAALARPVSEKRRARIVAWTLFLVTPLALVFAGVAWPFAVAAAVLVPVAGKLRTAARKVDAIFAEELVRETVPEPRSTVEIS